VKTRIIFKILVQFSLQPLKICKFSHFNKILLSLVSISNVFHDSFLSIIGVKMC